MNWIKPWCPKTTRHQRLWKGQKIYRYSTEIPGADETECAGKQMFRFYWAVQTLCRIWMPTTKRFNHRKGFKTCLKEAGKMPNTFWKPRADQKMWSHGQIRVRLSLIASLSMVHIYDLVKSVTSTHNVSYISKPWGWNTFFKNHGPFLNVPLSAIPNTMIRQAIAEYKEVNDTFDNEFWVVTLVTREKGQV